MNTHKDSLGKRTFLLVKATTNQHFPVSTGASKPGQDSISLGDCVSATITKFDIQKKINPIPLTLRIRSLGPGATCTGNRISTRHIRRYVSV